MRLAMRPKEASPRTTPFQATADPTITIDPSFAYTADFALELSPNIPAAVPEPGTTRLMLIGVALLGLVMRKRIAQGGHHEAS